MCHMFLLNVEFSNACRFLIFQCQFSIASRIPFPHFQVTLVLSTGSCPHLLANIHNIVTNSSC